MEISKSFAQRKHTKMGHFDPPDVFVNISWTTSIYSKYIFTFRGILEGHFGEKDLVLGQSSAKLWHEIWRVVDPKNLKILILTEIFKKFYKICFAVSNQNHKYLVESNSNIWK